MAARVICATLAFGLATGCASAPPAPRGVPQAFDPPSPDLRERAGKVAVVAASRESVRHRTTYSVGTPIRGAEEGAGYGVQSIGQVAQLGQMGHPLAALALVSGAAVVGAIMAHGSGEVMATEARLRQVLSETRAEEQFADMVAASAQRLSEPPAVTRARVDGDSAILPDAATAGVDSVQPAAWTALPEASPPATLLETSLPEMALSGERGFDPDVTLYIEAVVRLLDPHDRQVLWQRAYVYRSPPHAFFDLGEGDAAKLTAVLQRGLAKLAFIASFDIFAARHPEVHPDPERWSHMPQDTVWAVRRTASRLPPPKPPGGGVVTAQNARMPLAQNALVPAAQRAPATRNGPP